MITSTYRQVEDELQQELVNTRYLRVLVREERREWNAVMPVNQAFLDRPLSFTEWKRAIVNRYNEWTHGSVDAVLASEVVSEEYAMEWWQSRDSFGRPLSLESDPNQSPDPEDAF